MTEVEFTDDKMSIVAHGVVMGAWYQTHQIRHDYAIYYRSTGRIELYDNNIVRVFYGGRMSLEILFHTPDDARKFVDLVSSFVAGSKGG